MSNPDEATGAASTIGSYALAIARALEASGVERADVFRAAGISPQQSNDPMQRLSSVDINRLFAAAVEATGNPYFGLAVARTLHVSNLHALGYAISASDTLMDACRRIERSFRMLSDAAAATLVERDGEVHLSFTHLANPRGETEDAVLGFLIVIMRQLSDERFSPLRVAFRHPRIGTDDGPYEAHFRAPVSFDQPASVLVFSRDSLLAPLAGAIPELAQMNDAIASKYLVLLHKDDVVSRVKQAITERLPYGACTRKSVASAMGMSPTTLRLKLARRGATFLGLTDTTRKTLADSYIRQSALSITEIAFLLGFNNTSNFARAFRRWTGLSPSSFRERENALPSTTASVFRGN